jgi:vacuolar-type H+-ATPase subunit E/Vma4
MNKAVEQIHKSVREEAEGEAARIRREAEEQLKRLLEEARREEESKAEPRLRDEKARLEQNLLREVARAQRGARLACLEACNRVLEGVFSRVRDEVLRLPAERYRVILRRWLGELDASTGGNILPAARDAEALTRLVSEINSARDVGARLTLSRERAPILSGFIFRTPRYEVTKSLEAWLEEQKRNVAPRFEKELFKEAGNAHPD